MGHAHACTILAKVSLPIVHTLPILVGGYFLPVPIPMPMEGYPPSPLCHIITQSFVLLGVAMTLLHMQQHLNIHTSTTK